MSVEQLKKSMFEDLPLKTVIETNLKIDEKKVVAYYIYNKSKKGYRVIKGIEDNNTKSGYFFDNRDAMIYDAIIRKDGTLEIIDKGSKIIISPTNVLCIISFNDLITKKIKKQTTAKDFSSGTITSLINNFKSVNSYTQNSAIKDLVNLGKQPESSKQVIDSLIDALKDKDLRMYAGVTVLIKIGEPAVMPLIDALNKNRNNMNTTQCMRIIDALRNIGAKNPELVKNVVESLIKLLEDNDSDVRKAAVKALIKIGEPAVMPLIEALNNELNKSDDKKNAKVLSIIFVLGEIKDERAINRLNSIREKTGKDPELYSCVNIALTKIGSTISPSPKPDEKIQAVTLSQPEDKVKKKKITPPPKIIVPITSIEEEKHIIAKNLKTLYKIEGTATNEILDNALVEHILNLINLEPKKGGPNTYEGFEFLTIGNKDRYKILLVQLLCNKLMTNKKILVNGIYDSQTKEAVRNIQQKHEINATGNFGIKTLNYLKNVYITKIKEIPPSLISRLIEKSVEISELGDLDETVRIEPLGKAKNEIITTFISNVRNLKENAEKKIPDKVAVRPWYIWIPIVSEVVAYRTHYGTLGNKFPIYGWIKNMLFPPKKDNLTPAERKTKRIEYINKNIKSPLIISFNNIQYKIIISDIINNKIKVKGSKIVL